MKVVGGIDTFSRFLDKTLEIKTCIVLNDHKLIIFFINVHIWYMYLFKEKVSKKGVVSMKPLKVEVWGWKTAEAVIHNKDA